MEDAITLHTNGSCSESQTISHVISEYWIRAFKGTLNDVHIANRDAVE